MSNTSTTNPDAVEALIEKAAKAASPHDALHFSQAACNVANARSSAATAKSLSANT